MFPDMGMRQHRRINQENVSEIAQSAAQEHRRRRAAIVKAGGKHLFEHLESLDREFGIPVGWRSSEMSEDDWAFLISREAARSTLLRPIDPADEQTLLRPAMSQQPGDSASLLRVPISDQESSSSSD